MIEKARRVEGGAALYIIVVARQALPAGWTQIGGAGEYALDNLLAIVERYGGILLELNVVSDSPALRHQLGVLV